MKDGTNKHKNYVTHTGLVVGLAFFLLELLALEHRPRKSNKDDGWICPRKSSPARHRSDDQQVSRLGEEHRG